MKILELKDNQLQFEPEFLTVPEFNLLWKADKSKTKDKAFKELMYIYHMVDFNSPYVNYPENKKQESILHDILLDEKFKPSKEVELAILKYKQLIETPKQRLLAAARYKIDEIAVFLKDTPLTEDSSKSILELFKSISTTIKNFDDIENAVKKESEQGKSRVRGDKNVSLFEE